MTHAEVAADFDISVESVRRWVRQADVDDGVVDRQTSGEQNELVQLRRKAAGWSSRTRGPVSVPVQARIHRPALIGCGGLDARMPFYLGR